MLPQQEQQHQKNIPLFLLGHSMGGLITVLAADQCKIPFNGVVLSAPALRADPEVAKPYLVFIAKHLSWLLPKLSLDPLNSKAISRDAAVVQAYDSDPKVYRGGLRARFGHEILGAMDSINTVAKRIKYPLFVLQGGKDTLVVPDGARDLYTNAPSTDKKLKEYPELFHEIFNEPEKDQVLQDVLDWLNNHLA